MWFSRYDEAPSSTSCSLNKLLLGTFGPVWKLMEIQQLKLFGEAKLMDILTCFVGSQSLFFSKLQRNVRSKLSDEAEEFRSTINQTFGPARLDMDPFYDQPNICLALFSQNETNNTSKRLNN